MVLENGFERQGWVACPAQLVGAIEISTRLMSKSPVPTSLSLTIRWRFQITGYSENSLPSCPRRLLM